MTNTNGANHHNVEDLLANIRSSFGHDGNTARAIRPSSSLGTIGPLRGSGASVSEAASEFDLPAIFKPSQHVTPVEKPNLFGRLSDALKSPSVSGESERSRTVIRFEPAGGGRMFEPPRADRDDDSASASANAAANVTMAENASVKREMPSFFDTRLKGLGQSNKPAPVPPVQSTPSTALTTKPPALPPEGSYAMATNGAVEDAAAQMLRPILRQWLTENMPKIVEKALRSEMGIDGQPFPPGSSG